MKQRFENLKITLDIYVLYELVKFQSTPVPDPPDPGIIVGMCIAPGRAPRAVQESSHGMQLD